MNRRLLWTWLGLLLLPAPVWAHALGADWKILGNQVVVEAFFDDDSPAVAALVHVRSGPDALVLSGKTDAKGVFAFELPQPGQYKVQVDADGHRHVMNIIISAAASEQFGGARVSREEFTRYPWLKVGIGLASIAGFALAFWLTRRQRPSNNVP